MMAQAGLQVEAWDPSREMAKAAATHDGVRAHQRDFEALPDVPTYDGIYANFSLLHVPRADGIRHIHTCHKALYTGGVLHLGMKTGSGARRGTH